MNNFLKVRLNPLICFLVLSRLFTTPSLAEDISLNEALYEAIRENLALKVDSYEQILGQQDVIIAESAFDSTLFGNAGFTEEEQDFNLTTSESRSASLGITKQFSTGTTVTLSNNFFRNQGSRFDPDLNQQIGGGLNNTNTISLSVRQPLLRGFGRDANRANLNRAEMQLEIAELDYRNSLLDIVNQAEVAYWQAAFQKARLELTETSLQVAQSLLENNVEREKVGRATKIDVLQAEANLAAQQETFIEAQRDRENAIDRLLTVMGRLRPEYQDEELSVSELPEPGSYSPTLAETWGGALNTDLNLITQGFRIGSLAFDRIIANDQNKTRLDLVLSGESIGLSNDTANDAFTSALEREGHEIGARIELNVPIGKRASRARVSRIEAIIEREEVRLERIEQLLFQEVRSQWRTLESSLESLKASRASLTLQEEVFQQEQAKFNNGLAVFRDVQEAQDDLNRARIRELNAWIAALVAEADLRRLDGSLLETRNIDLNFE